MKRDLPVKLPYNKKKQQTKRKLKHKLDIILLKVTASKVQFILFLTTENHVNLM